jgi:hypothetical protein
MGNIAIAVIKTEFIDILESIEAWQHRHDFPFDFFCQCSLEVAEYDGIIDRMVRIGHNMLFIGTESVDASSFDGHFYDSSI